VKSWFSRSASLAACAALLASCGTDTVAGKTTTTSNGGGGLMALGPDGRPLAGSVALAARSWDPVRGAPGAIDTVRADSLGRIALPESLYAFLEIRDSGRTIGAWRKRFRVVDGLFLPVSLDTLRSFQGTWADRAGIGQGRVYLDSSLGSAALQRDGTFAFATVSPGDYSLRLVADTQLPRPLGRVQLARHDVRYVGSGNVILDGDTTGSPLWIQDFESGTNRAPVIQSAPGASPWYIWASQFQLLQPTATDSAAMLQAFVPDSTRPGRVFHARFAGQSPYAWIGTGLTGLELDLSARTQLCFAYRTDTLLKIQFQRDSLDAIRPTLSAILPPSPRWRDACVPTTDFVPNPDTPDSLWTWSAFGKRVLVIEFQTPSGGTYLGLDDIRMR